MELVISSIRNNQEKIAWSFILVALALLTDFVVVQYTVVGDWSEFIWVPIYGLCFALVGFAIEISRLNWELSKVSGVTDPQTLKL